MPKLNTGMVPGRYGRDGISLPKLAQMFPDEDTVRTWIEKVVWPEGLRCPRCKGNKVHESPHKTMPSLPSMQAVLLGQDRNRAGHL